MKYHSIAIATQQLTVLLGMLVTGLAIPSLKEPWAPLALAITGIAGLGALKTKPQEFLGHLVLVVSAVVLTMVGLQAWSHYVATVTIITETQAACVAITGIGVVAFVMALLKCCDEEQRELRRQVDEEFRRLAELPPEHRDEFVNHVWRENPWAGEELVRRARKEGMLGA